jgi:hypothetical protein
MRNSITILLLFVALNSFSQQKERYTIDSTLEVKTKKYRIIKRIVTKDSVTFFFFNNQNEIFRITNYKLKNPDRVYNYFYLNDSLARIDISIWRKAKRHFLIFYFKDGHVFDQIVKGIDVPDVGYYIEKSKELYNQSLQIIKD